MKLYYLNILPMAWKSHFPESIVIVLQGNVAWCDKSSIKLDLETYFLIFYGDFHTWMAFSFEIVCI